MAFSLGAIVSLMRGTKPYSLYVLLVLMIVYTVNQLDRFVLGIASRSIASDLQFATFGCFPDPSVHSLPHNVSCIGACTKITNESLCTVSKGVPCQWDYSATGIKYEILAGPAFTLMFTLVAIPLGVLAGYHWVNRKVALSVAMVLWSVMTLLAGFTQEFWQLLLTRVGLGIFEAVCTPFATSIISDYIEENSRGAALGFYNWGIYIGYSLAFAFNFILLSIGWRWAFRIASFPGFLLAGLLFITVKEPERRQIGDVHSRLMQGRGSSMIRKVFRGYLQPTLLLLCVAGGFRQGGGLVWAYNVKAYFYQYYCGTVNVGEYLSWVPLVGGTIGAVVGGFVSDRLAKSRGDTARLWVLVVSQLAAAPFLLGTIYLPPEPWAFLSLIPAYAIGEMWIGVCLAIVINMAPLGTSPATVALFLFIINNIGGAMTLLIPPLEASIGLQYALIILFPGLYVVAAGLFALTLVVVKCNTMTCGRRSHGTRLHGPRETSPLIQKEDKEDDDDFEESETAVEFFTLEDSTRLPK